MEDNMLNEIFKDEIKKIKLPAKIINVCISCQKILPAENITCDICKKKTIQKKGPFYNYRDIEKTIQNHLNEISQDISKIDNSNFDIKKNTVNVQEKKESMSSALNVKGKANSNIKLVNERPVKTDKEASKSKEEIQRSLMLKMKQKKESVISVTQNYSETSMPQSVPEHVAETINKETEKYAEEYRTSSENKNTSKDSKSLNNNTSDKTKPYATASEKKELDSNSENTDNKKTAQAGDTVITSSEVYSGYKKSHIDIRKIEEVGDRILETSYKESEAEQGKSTLKNKIKETNLLEGAVASARSAGRISTINTMYGNTSIKGDFGKKYNSSSITFEGKKYTINSLQQELSTKISLHTSLSHTNVVIDFEHNKHALEAYLIKKYRVDTSKMTYQQLQRAIKKGELSHKIGSSSISLIGKNGEATELAKALMLMSQYKKMEPDIISLKAKGSSSIKNVASSFTNTATSQGDFGDGLNAIKTGRRTAGKVMLVGRASINGSIALGVHVGNMGTRIFSEEAKQLKALKENSGLSRKDYKRVIKSKPDAILTPHEKNILENYRELQGRTADKIGKRNQFRMEARPHPLKYLASKPVNAFIKLASKGNYTGMADIKKQYGAKLSDTLLNKHTIVDGKKVTMKVKNAAGEDVAVRKLSGKIVDKFNITKQKYIKAKEDLAKTIIAKIAKKPFEFFSFTGKIKNAIILGAGFLLIIVAMISALGASGSGIVAFFANVSDDEDGNMSELAEQAGISEQAQIIQATVDEMYRKQQERFNNLVNCTDPDSTPIYTSWHFATPTPVPSEEEENNRYNTNYADTPIDEEDDNDTGEIITTIVAGQEYPCGVFFPETSIHSQTGEILHEKGEPLYRITRSGRKVYFEATWKLNFDVNSSATAVYNDEGVLVGYNFYGTNGDIPTITYTIKDVYCGAIRTNYSDRKAINYKVSLTVPLGASGNMGRFGNGNDSDVTGQAYYSHYKITPESKFYDRRLKYETLVQNMGNNSGVFFDVKYKGSPSLLANASPHGKYFDIVKDSMEIKTMRHSDYTIYKNILTMAYGFTQNNTETFDYYYNYCQYIHDTLLKKADITVETAFEETGDYVVFNFSKNNRSDIDGQCYYSYSFALPVFNYFTYVDVTVDNCDLYNMMDHDEVSDIQAHQGSIGTYEEQDPNSPDYVKWDSWFHVYEEYIPGQEYLGKVVREEFNENSELAVTLWKMEDDVWDELFYHVKLPGAPSPTPVPDSE